MSEVTALIAEIRANGLLRAGNRLEELYSLATKIETDNAELKAQRDALAAENAALLAACRCLAKDCAQSAGEAELTMSGIKTPATDAYLNSVRAEGAASVGTMIRACAHEFPDSVEGIVEECAMIADNRAIILSAGEPS